eukprot:CAMPEP_0169393908 /NCGR_PEP_ID=MMETSP1017-20121227/49679_1 /TAXON_ID=342587 /ORGANISM="Karlodinium micrum, Strain CCMP2283" /LENGTH=109 /DNA_ID=CAMNT_0009497499 /DNA_START=42 /DNA_END=372 /DNA_ORIENTATION=-
MSSGGFGRAGGGGDAACRRDRWFFNRLWHTAGLTSAEPSGRPRGKSLVQDSRSTLVTIASSKTGTAESSFVTSIHTKADSHFILKRKWYLPGKGNFARISRSLTALPLV